MDGRRQRLLAAVRPGRPTDRDWVGDGVGLFRIGAPDPEEGLARGTVHRGLIPK